jgi:hypothetical protein
MLQNQWKDGLVGLSEIMIWQKGTKNVFAIQDCKSSKFTQCFTHMVRSVFGGAADQTLANFPDARCHLNDSIDCIESGI